MNGLTASLTAAACNAKMLRVAPARDYLHRTGARHTFHPFVPRVPSRGFTRTQRAELALAADAKKASSTSGQDDPASSESKAYEKRKQESKEAGIDKDKIRPPQGGDPPPPGSWEWTLNWDYIEEGIVIGSCPRQPEDVDRLAREAGIQAIVCLQSDVCHEAMKINWQKIEQRAQQNGILVTRVPVRDFDRLDQALMVPEMAKAVAVCRALGRKTYVHCTAGINRASLAVIAYYIWVLGMPREEATHLVRTQRPQANPYMGSFDNARSRLLAGREQDIYIKTQDKGNSMVEGGDWVWRDWTTAEDEVIVDTLTRQVAATLSCIKGTAAVFAAAAGAIACTDVEANLAAAKISASMDDCMEETEDE